LSPELEGTRRALFGAGPGFELATVRGTDFVIVGGTDPRALRAVLFARAPDASTAGPALAAALTRTRGADALFFLDLATFATRVIETAPDPRVHQAAAMMHALPALKDLHLPLVLAARTGGQAVYELRLPFEAFENVARVVRPYMGVMGNTTKLIK
jgi:hypothetical protein